MLRLLRGGLPFGLQLFLDRLFEWRRAHRCNHVAAIETS
jgi:hypothetical protein